MAAGTRLCILIGSFALTNIFVLYYQTNGHGSDNTIEQRDAIRAPLNLQHYALDEHKIDRAKVPTKENHKQVWELFDASTCVGHGFRIYVHDLSPKLTNSSSAKALHDALNNSSYSTKDLKQACLFVYVAHGAEELISLPFWNRDGEGLLVIFAGGPTTSTYRYPNRRAFFVGEEMNTAPFADIQLFTQQEAKKQQLPLIHPFEKRKYLLNLLVAQPVREVFNYFSASMSKSIKVDFDCKPGSNESMALCKDRDYRIKQLNNSIFTLLHPKMTNFAQRLHETLLFGSIPVFIGSENDANLPFHDLIQWRRAILFFPPHYTHEIQTILPEVKVEKILELRRNGRFYLENYLLGANNLVRSILTAYRHRLSLPAPEEKTFKAEIIYSTHPIVESVKPKSSVVDLDENIAFAWNQNPIYMDARPSVPIRYANEPPLSDMDQWIDGQKMISKEGEEYRSVLTGNYPDEKFTAVMVSYKRDEQVTYTLEMLDGVRFLDRIILIWNDYNRSLPDNLIPKMKVPTFVVNASRNSLNNRFLPFDLIHTEAVLNMDDDFNTDPETIEFSFRVWRENRVSIVGPNYRLGYVDKKNEGVYAGSDSCQQNMILTSGAFIHRLYHRAYTQMISPEFIAHIDSKFNCEDIAINFLIAHLTRKQPIKTTPITNTRGKKSKGGLHTRGNHHYSDRAKCVAMLVKEFGYNPLIISEYRVDSIHHGRGKCYKTT
ncbi:Exostosin-like 3 [Aphelenchoides bicaudatus]|nr:Exostosin-like 3 [Aphelenchoides bicaudatus]